MPAPSERRNLYLSVIARAIECSGIFESVALSTFRGDRSAHTLFSNRSNLLARKCIRCTRRRKPVVVCRRGKVPLDDCSHHTALACSVVLNHLQAYANKNCPYELTYNIGYGAGARVLPSPGVRRFAVSHQARVHQAGPHVPPARPR